MALVYLWQWYLSSQIFRGLKSYGDYTYILTILPIDSEISQKKFSFDQSPLFSRLPKDPGAPVLPMAGSIGSILQNQWMSQLLLWADSWRPA